MMLWKEDWVNLFIWQLRLVQTTSYRHELDRFDERGIGLDNLASLTCTVLLGFSTFPQLLPGLAHIVRKRLSQSNCFAFQTLCKAILALIVTAEARPSES